MKRAVGARAGEGFRGFEQQRDDEKRYSPPSQAHSARLLIGPTP